MKIRPPMFAVGDEKKGKERYTKSQVGYISAIWGANPVGPISTKIGKVVGVYDVIIHSKFAFNIFRAFRSTGGQNFCFPIDCWSSLQQCYRYMYCAACDHSCSSQLSTLDTVIIISSFLSKVVHVAGRTNTIIYIH